MSALSFVIPSEAMPSRSSRSSSSSPTARDSDGRATVSGSGTGESSDRRSVLMALLELVRTEVDLDSLLRRVVDLVAQAMAADRATLFLIDKSTGELVSRAAHLPELPEIRLPAGQGIAGHVWQTRRPIAASNADDHPRFAASIDRITGYKTVTVLAAPVLAPATLGGEPEALGVLQVLNKKAGLFDDRDRELLCELAGEVATALSETALHERVTGQASERYHRIVGSSPSMRRVYEIIARAAATSATVLLRGESGTGKELAARAIHFNSSRARGPFVKIDCTAIPEGLMESELFGHERGAFTGAEQRVLGKAELAHGGTLFLDEIGDLKPSLQGKLLRLLQDREFERVGGRKTIAVDLRIIAATNCDLAAMAEAKTFRTDLYYRLKVIELMLPSLRERGSEDIERLALHFAELYARRHKKPQRGLSAGALRRLRSHSWPGNIRELENVLERTILFCKSERIERPDLQLGSTGGPEAPVSGPVPVVARTTSSGAMPPITEDDDDDDDGVVGEAQGSTSGSLKDIVRAETSRVERELIVKALEETGGNVTQAARLLKISRKSLQMKMKELGLRDREV